MKWIALLFILLAAPLIAAWLRTNPRQAPYIWGLLTFLPFVSGPWNLDVAPYSIATWSGYVKGWEFGLLDAVAFGIVFGTRGRWPKMVLVGAFAAYMFAVFIAIFQARFPNFASAYSVQLLRVFLVFLAVARIAALERGERALLMGLILGLSVQAGYALWERANGALQTGGSLGHQNLLGFVSHMALMPAFALFLSGRMPRIALVGVLAGLTVVVLTASRATIGIALLGLTVTLFLSILLRFTSRKALVGLAGVVILAASFPLANATLDRRFEAQGTTFFSEDHERAAFERAAKAMIGDHPFGVGPNHYVFIANTEGYSDRAGVNWNFGSRATQVHNTFLLVTAETGYIGLITLLFLLISGVFYALGGAWRFRRQPGSEILVGFGVGVIAIFVHGLVEWMFVVSPTQYVFAGSLGFIVGLRHRFAEQKRLTGYRKSAPQEHQILSSGRARLA